MSAKKRSQSPTRRWEQSLIDAFYDYRWHQVLDPLEGMRFINNWGSPWFLIHIM